MARPVQVMGAARETEAAAGPDPAEGAESDPAEDGAVGEVLHQAGVRRQGRHLQNPSHRARLSLQGQRRREDHLGGHAEEQTGEIVFRSLDLITTDND